MRNKPRIRFKGFTEDWEQRKVNEIFKVTRGQVLAASLTTPEKNRRNIYPVYSSQTKDNGLLGYYSEYLFENAITWTTDGANAGTVNFRPGRFYSTNVNGVLINENGYACYAVSEIINKVAYKYVSKVGNPKLMNNVMAEINIMITPDIDELKQISKLIEAYNQYITLHQRKLEKLKLAKKALLQKLFPKNGSQFPEIRFKGFTDAWEQRKLDDIAKIKTGGGTPKTANPEYWSGNIPWIQSSDLVEGDIVHVNINKFINNNALKNSAAKLISRDSIALVTRVGVGKVAVINQDFTTSQDFLSLSDFDRSDIKFLAYQLYRLMQENAKVLQGTSIKGITKTELIEQSISIPSSGQEQNLISNVLSKIDSFITLHQCKLDKLQDVKKGLLQKMFV